MNRNNKNFGRIVALTLSALIVGVSCSQLQAQPVQLGNLTSTIDVPAVTSDKKLG